MKKILKKKLYDILGETAQSCKVIKVLESGENYSTLVSPRFLITYGHIQAVAQFALSNNVLGGGHFINIESFYNTNLPVSAVLYFGWDLVKNRYKSGPQQTEFVILAESDIPYADDGFELGIMVSMIDTALDDLCNKIDDIATKSNLNDFDGEPVLVDVIPYKPFRVDLCDIKRIHDESAIERMKLIISRQKLKNESSVNSDSKKDKPIRDIDTRKFINEVEARLTELDAGISFIKDLKTGEDLTAFIVSMDDISLPANASADIVIAVTDSKRMLNVVVRDHSFRIKSKNVEFIQTKVIIDPEESSPAAIGIRSDRVDSIVDYITKGVAKLHVDMLRRYAVNAVSEVAGMNPSKEKKEELSLASEKEKEYAKRIMMILASRDEELKKKVEKDMSNLADLIIGIKESECNLADSIMLSAARQREVNRHRIPTPYIPFFDRLLNPRQADFDDFTGDILAEIKFNKKKPW